MTMRKTKKGRAHMRDRAEYHLLRAVECAKEAGLANAARQIDSYAYTVINEMEREAERVESEVRVRAARAARELLRRRRK